MDFTFLVRAYPGSSGKEAVKWVFVCFSSTLPVTCKYSFHQPDVHAVLKIFKK